jgi:hypothetical protein
METWRKEKYLLSEYKQNILNILCKVSLRFILYYHSQMCTGLYNRRGNIRPPLQKYLYVSIPGVLVSFYSFSFLFFDFILSLI